MEKLQLAEEAGADREHLAWIGCCSIKDSHRSISFRESKLCSLTPVCNNKSKIQIMH